MTWTRGLDVNMSRDGCSPRGDISKELLRPLQRADLWGFVPPNSWQNVPFRPSENFLKPSKISPPPENEIDIALRGTAIPGASLARPPQ